jgi:hypothetical protein
MKYIFVLFAAFFVSPVFAQDQPAAAVPALGAPAVDEVTAPAAAPILNPAEPDAATTAAATSAVPTTLQPNAGNFPPLPPSRPCARPDTDGLWKLKNVFENPRGPTTSDFANNPHQYILFLRDDTYRTYKDVWGEKSSEQVRTELETTPAANLQQFLVHESGMIFFYVDGVNIDSQACFIVANPRGSYLAGQMILMPPEGRIATRLAMVYERIVRPSEVINNDVQPNPGKPRRRRAR